MCLISLVDKDMQYFVGAFGVAGLRETGRDVSFCAHAIMPDAPAVLSVYDASLDSRFSANPLVTGSPGIRFYAGAPLNHPTTRSRLGTLCLIDNAPRHLTSGQSEQLREAADYVVSVLDSLARSAPLPQQGAAMPACFQPPGRKSKASAILPVAPTSTDLALTAHGASPLPPPPRPVIPVRGLKLENLALTSDQLHVALRRFAGREGATVRAVGGEHCLRVLFPACASSAEKEATDVVEMSVIIFAERTTGVGGASVASTRAGAMEGSSNTAARLHLHVRRLSGDALAFGRFYRGMREEIPREMC